MLARMHACLRARLLVPLLVHRHTALTTPSTFQRCMNQVRVYARVRPFLPGDGKEEQVCVCVTHASHVDGMDGHHCLCMKVITHMHTRTCLYTYRSTPPST